MTHAVIAIRVPGEPVAKGRPLFSTKTGRARTPERTKTFEAAVAFFGSAEKIGFIDGVLSVEIDAVFRRPKALENACPDTRIYKATKPDADNVAKSCLDGLKAHFHDQQVARLLVRKAYAARGEEPCTLIKISVLSPSNKGEET